MCGERERQRESDGEGEGESIVAFIQTRLNKNLRKFVITVRVTH